MQNEAMETAEDLARARAYIDQVLAIQKRYGHGTPPPDAYERAVVEAARWAAKLRAVAERAKP